MPRVVEDVDAIYEYLVCRLKLKGHYMYVAGFYIYSIFALLFWETRRKDFGVSMGHHVASLTLIVLSYMTRYCFDDYF